LKNKKNNSEIWTDENQFPYFCKIHLKKNMKIINVSYRLPISFRKTSEGVERKTSDGGLASSILSFAEKTHYEITWAGIADFEITLWDAKNECRRDGMKMEPVFLPKQLEKNFYQGFSNSVLYPLFSYFPSYAEYKQEYWDAYLEANRKMAEKVILLYEKDDIIWIHDYHFIPLAGLIRNELPEAKIGFFLHIPFPNIELIKLLPRHVQSFLFINLLQADLIGFHTWDYTLHFIECAEIILGATRNNFNLIYKNRETKTGAYPISIDFNKFNEAFDQMEVKTKRDNINNIYLNKKIIFSVDRLDYTKGVLYRLSAYEKFLEQNPQWMNRVVFIMVIIPSREEISRNSERKSIIELAISRINGKLGNYNWTPVVFQYKPIKFDELMALYTSCDIALVLAVRDGMNLVAKEFVASRNDLRGVLLLSELIDAAKELQEAIIFHPLDIQEIADSIQAGLNMSPNEQESRLKTMQTYLSKNDVFKWAAIFLGDLKEKQQKNAIALGTDARNNLLEKYSKARNRLILLDYDGTLAPFHIDPEKAIPDPEILDILENLKRWKKNEVWIISGREKEFLDKHFAYLNINLVAEHGSFIKRNEWKSQLPIMEVELMDEVNYLLTNFVDLYPGTFIEKKQNSIAWHYRAIEHQKGFIASRELLKQLKAYMLNKKLSLLDGSYVIEIKFLPSSKGSVYEQEIANEKFDVVIALGDDKTDEDLFKCLTKPFHYSIKIGKGYTNASYRLENIQLATSFLNVLKHIL